MKKEQAKILYEDLSARLPYGTKIHRVWVAPMTGSPEEGDYDLDLWDLDCLSAIAECGEAICNIDGHTYCVKKYDIKPYYRPLSSMTQGEQDELHDWGFDYHCGEYGVSIQSGQGLDINDNLSNYTMTYTDAIWLVKWLITHHFDYNGLIEKGLALPALEETYNI